MKSKSLILSGALALLLASSVSFAAPGGDVVSPPPPSSSEDPTMSSGTTVTTSTMSGVTSMSSLGTWSLTPGFTTATVGKVSSVALDGGNCIAKMVVASSTGSGAVTAQMSLYDNTQAALACDLLIERVKEGSKESDLQIAVSGYVLVPSPGEASGKMWVNQVGITHAVEE